MNKSWPHRQGERVLQVEGTASVNPANEVDLDLHWSCRQDRRMVGLHKFLDMLEDEDRL